MGVFVFRHRIGSAFVAFIGTSLHDIRCVKNGALMANDNTMRYGNHILRIPE
jgi:hypothetical protein